MKTFSTRFGHNSESVLLVFPPLSPWLLHHSDITPSARRSLLELAYSSLLLPNFNLSNKRYKPSFFPVQHGRPNSASNEQLHEVTIAWVAPISIAAETVPRPFPIFF